MIWNTIWLIALYMMVPLGMAFGSFVLVRSSDSGESLFRLLVNGYGFKSESRLVHTIFGATEECENLP